MIDGGAASTNAALLKQVRNRWRLLMVLRAATLAAAASALVLGLALATDRLLDPQGACADCVVDAGAWGRSGLPRHRRAVDAARAARRPARQVHRGTLP